MNRLIKRCFLMFLLTAIFVVPAFTESWYLCLGSFKQEKNAEILVNSLKDGGLEAVIDSFEKNSEMYYRVLLADCYEDRNVARNKISEVEALPVIKNLKISGIWICTGSDKVKAPAKTTEKKAEDVTSKLVIENAKSQSTVKKVAAAEPVVETPKTEEAKEPAKTPAKEVVAEEPVAEPEKVAETKKEQPKVTVDIPAKNTSTTKKTTTTKSTKTPAKSTKSTKTTTTTAKTEKTAAEKVVEKPAKVEAAVVEVAEEPAKAPAKEVVVEEPVKEEPVVEEPVAKTPVIKLPEAAKSVQAVVVEVPEEKAEETSVEESPVEEPAIEEPAPAAPVELEVPVETPAVTVETPAEVQLPVIETIEPEELPEETVVAEEPEISIPLNVYIIDDSKKLVLKPNYIDNLEFSEEIPFTVFLHSYKTEEAAEYDKARLDTLNVSSFILKLYTEDTGFSFNLYSGAFETKEDAEEFQKELKLLGVIGSKITEYSKNYTDFKRYNDLVLNKTVASYEFADIKKSDCLNEAVLKSISKAPVNKDYQISELVVADMKNIDAAELEDTYIDDLKSYMYQKDRVDGAVLATLEDPLFGNQVSVYVQTGSDFDEEGIKTEVERKITIGNDTYRGYISIRNNANCITVLNESATQLIRIVGNNLSDAMFNIYITTMFDDDALYTNAEFKKAMSVLPVKNSDNSRKFQYMLLETIDEGFAAEEGFDYCAEKLTGNTWTWTYFTQNEKEVEAITLNLNYDLIADDVYASLYDKKLDGSIGLSNRPSYVPFVDSWVTIDDEMSELTTKIRSYITITLAEGATLSETDLVLLVEDMQLLSR